MLNIVELIGLLYFIAIDWSFCIIKVICDRGNDRFSFKDTMQNDKLYTFANEWNFDKRPQNR